MDWLVVLKKCYIFLVKSKCLWLLIIVLWPYSWWLGWFRNRRSIINLEFKIGNGVSATLPLARFSVMFLRNYQLRLLLKLLIRVSTYLTLLRKFIIFLKFDDPFLYFSPILLVFRCVFSGISGFVICYFNCCCTKIEFFVTHFGVRSVFVILKSIRVSCLGLETNRVIAKLLHLYSQLIMGWTGIQVFWLGFRPSLFYKVNIIYCKDAAFFIWLDQLII